MGRKWEASITMELGSLTEEEIKNDKRVREFFDDPDSPTDEEIRAYFEDIQQNYAGSNTGSEMIANEVIDVVCTNDDPEEE